MSNASGQGHRSRSGPTGALGRRLHGRVPRGGRELGEVRLGRRACRLRGRRSRAQSVGSHPRRARRGNKVLKRVLYRSAFSCISHHERSEAFYRRKRAEGKGHHQALIALARRRVDVLWAMLRDGQTYSERPSQVA